MGYRSPSAVRMTFRVALAPILVWGLVLAYAGLFAWLSLTRHWAFATDAYDLGNVNQAMWNTVHGRPLYFTNWRGVELNLASDSRLAMHVEPIYFLIAPIYWLWQQPETLLVLQTVLLALGAWPVFWLARERLQSELAGVTFAAAYLLFPGLEAANLWEFHAVALAVPLLLFAFYFGQAGRWGLLWLFAVLAMGTKEEIPLVVMLMGLYFTLWGIADVGQPGQDIQLAISCRLRRPQVVHGLTLFLVALSWFLIATLVIIPHFGGGQSPYLSYYGDLGNGPAELLKTLVTRPQALLAALLTHRNLRYLTDLYTPVAFLSLLSPLTLAFSAPDLMINLLSTHEPMHFVEKYHYVAPVLPGVMISGILGASWLVRRLSAIRLLGRRGSVLIIAFAVVTATAWYHRYHGYTPLARAFEPYRITSHHRLGEAIARTIPLDAAVAAQRNLNPHVSGRRTLYRFPYIGDAEYVFLDVSTMASEGFAYGLVRELLEDGRFGVIRAEDGYLLLRRGVPSAAGLPETFYSFLRWEPGNSPWQPQKSTDVVFGESLRLIGFDMSAARRTEMPQTPLRFTLYWQVIQPPKEDYRFALYLLDDQRRPIGGMNLDREPGAEYWYPTSRWQAGEMIKLELSNMPWWTAQYPSYAVALGVQIGEDPWEVSARLKPEVRGAIVLTPYADSGTLVELMRFRTDPGGMPVALVQPPRLELSRHLLGQQAMWSNSLELVGYRVSARKVRPGKTLNVVLYWRTQHPLRADYTVFVHLANSGRVVAGHDSEPDFGGYPTSSWLPGQLIPDRHPIQLPLGLEPGTYELVIGFYDASTGNRVLLNGGEDAVKLSAQITVR
jgi:uncharacterized membrane protein